MGGAGQLESVTHKQAEHDFGIDNFPYSVSAVRAFKVSLDL